MPNWCDCTYKCVGDLKEVKSLYKILKYIDRRKTSIEKNGFGKWGYPFSSGTHCLQKGDAAHVPLELSDLRLSGLSAGEGLCPCHPFPPHRPQGVSAAAGVSGVRPCHAGGAGSAAGYDGHLLALGPLWRAYRRWNTLSISAATGCWESCSGTTPPPKWT